MDKNLEVGDLAPNFTLPTVAGEFDLQQQLRESKAGVVIFFYPRANTPGCTREACDFRDNEQLLAKAGYRIVGVSPDKVEKLEKFAEEFSLTYPLAADVDRQVMQTYGAFGEKKNYGKIVQGVIRSTVVVAKDGKISHLWRNVKATGHVGRIVKELGL